MEELWSRFYLDEDPRAPGVEDSKSKSTAGASASAAPLSSRASLIAEDQLITEPQPVSPIGLAPPPRRLQPSGQGQAEAELSANDNDTVTEPCVPTKEEMQAMTLAAAIRHAAASNSNAATNSAARAVVGDQELGVPGVPWSAAVHGAEPCGTNTPPVVANAPSSAAAGLSPAAVLSSSSSAAAQPAASSSELAKMRAEMATLRGLMEQMEARLAAQA
jgi:hypothetical protein